MKNDRNTEQAAKRLEIIQAASQLGLRKTEELYGVTKKTIIAWKKKYSSAGEAGLVNKQQKKNNHPAAMAAESVAQIQQLHTDNPTLSAAQIKKILNLDCSIPTILKKMKLSAIREVTVSESSHWEIGLNRAGTSDDGRVYYLYTARELNSDLLFLSIAAEKTVQNLQRFLTYFLHAIKNQTAGLKTIISFSTAAYHQIAGRSTFLNQLLKEFSQVKIEMEWQSKTPSRALPELKIQKGQSIENYLEHLRNLFLFQNYLKLGAAGINRKISFVIRKPLLLDRDNQDFSLHSTSPASDRQLIETFNELLALLYDFQNFSGYNRYLEVIESFLADLISYLTGMDNYSGMLINICLLQGNFYFVQKRYDLCKISFEQALSLSESKQNSYLMTECYLRLAETELKLRRNIPAKLNLKKGYDLAVKNKQAGQILALLALLGYTHESTLNYYAAQKIYNQQFELAVENNHPRDYSLALSCKARLLFLNGHFDKAITSAEKCLVIALKYSTYSVICSLYSTLGLACQEKKLLHRAETNFYSQLEYAKKSADYQLIAQALANLGYCECLLNDFDLGNKKMEAAYKLCQKENDQAGIIKALGFLAKSSVLAGNYKKAVFLYNTLLKQKEYFGTIEQLPNYYGNLTICYLKLNKTVEAMEIATKRYDLVKFSGNRQQMSLAVSKLGAVYLAMKKYKEAVRCFREQISILKSLGDRARTAVAYANLAETYALQKKFSMAEKCQQKSNQINKEIEGEVFLSMIY